MASENHNFAPSQCKSEINMLRPIAGWASSSCIENHTDLRFSLRGLKSCVAVVR
jgi:hypothetical protein